MHEQFYQLGSAAFKLLPDRRFFFGSRIHRRAMAYMRFGLRQGQGFIVITGPVGTGKSMLVAQLFAELDADPIVTAHVSTTHVMAEDALRLVLRSLGITAPAQDKATLLHALEEFLVAQHQIGRRVLLVVDEAQNLPRETLEELRMLSNMNIGGEALLQCFFLGQPQFLTRVSHPRFEQLRQRIVASCQLEPISESETRDYVQHRLRTAGWCGEPPFTPRALVEVHTASGGVPRRINLLCSRLLLFGAIEELHCIDENAVRLVLDDLRAEAEPTAEQGPCYREALDEVVSDERTASRLLAIEETLCEQGSLLRDLLRIAGAPVQSVPPHKGANE